MKAEELALAMAIRAVVSADRSTAWQPLLPYASALIEARQALDECDCFGPLGGCEEPCMRCAALARLDALLEDKP